MAYSAKLLQDDPSVVVDELLTPGSYFFDPREKKVVVDDDFSTKAVSCMKKYRRLLAVMWLLVFCGAAYFAPQLLSNTVLAFTPPGDSPAAKGTRALEQFCPTQAKVTNLVILAEMKDGTDITESKAVKAFSFALNETLYEEYGDYMWGVQGYFLLLKQNPLLKSIAEELLQHKNGKLASPPTSTLVIVSTKDDVASTSSISFADALRKKVSTLAPDNSNVDFRLTGLPALYTGIMASTESNLAEMDAIVVPFAMIILGIMFKSCRLLSVTLMSLAVSFAVAFAVVDWYALAGLQILTAAPSLMGSILLAMSIDYGLFFFTRLQLELHSARLEIVSAERYPIIPEDRLEIVIANVIRSSGKIIVTSGVTLTICFLGLLFLPLNLIQSIGVGCATSLVITMAVTLTLCPVMILLFPVFFTTGCCGARAGEDLRMPSLSNADPEIGKSAPLVDGASFGNEGPRRRKSSRTSLSSVHRGTMWYKIGLMTQHPVGSIVVLAFSCALVFFFGRHAFNPTLSTTLVGFLPRDGPDRITLSKLESDFAPGTVYPFSIMLRVGSKSTEGRKYFNSTNVLSDHFISTAQTMLNTWTDPKGQLLPRGTHLQSILDFDSIELTGQQIRGAIDHSCDPGDYICAAAAPLLSTISKQFLNKDRTATIVQLELGVDAFGKEARDWIKTFRKTLKQNEVEYGIEVSMSGFGADVCDSVEYVYDAWPRMIYIITGVVLVMVACAFRSIILAVRGIVTIGMTILFVQGLAKMTYCDGVFSFTKWGSIASTDGLIWLVPPTVFPILVGIALDYDIFFIARIVEFKEEGLSTRDAILAGMSETGNIITAAGVIQTLAFFGLLLGTIPVLNQLSFYLLFGVLFDTFLVRVLVVPSLMYWLGELNWWPSKY